MKRISLAESELGIQPDDVTRLFEPFTAAEPRPGDEAWEREVARRERKIRRRYLKRKLLGVLPSSQRSEAVVREEYGKAWDGIEYDEYDMNHPLVRLRPWEWQGREMMASDVGGTRVRQLILCRLIERLKPRSVLEVGCGNGINLLLLAGRFPEVRFHGVDLTRTGPLTLRGMQVHRERYPEGMQAYAPLELPDPAGFQRVKVVQGNATCLPFRDGAFDLVITILALEQMERIREQALAEVARVAGRHTMMLEPFRDVNDSGWAKKYVIARNYFRGRIDDLPRYGLRPVMALDDFPQETHLKACAVLSEKDDSAAAAEAGV